VSADIETPSLLSLLTVDAIPVAIGDIGLEIELIDAGQVKRGLRARAEQRGAVPFRHRHGESVNAQTPCD
jgi:hypothetical protein